MNIYRGLRDEKSDPCQKHSGDKVPANFRGRRRKRVAFWPGLEGGWDFRSHFKELGAGTVPRGERVHVRFPPSPLASIPPSQSPKGVSWLLHPTSAMSFFKPTFLKETLIATTQSWQVMKIATTLYLFLIYFYLEDNCFATLHWFLPYDNVNRLLFSCSVMSDSLRDPRLPCASLSPRVCSNSGPLSQWYHPTISPPVGPFSRPQSFPASGSFPMSWLSVTGVSIHRFPPSHLSPLGHHRTPGWTPYASGLPTSYFIHGNVYVSMLLSTRPTFSFPCRVHMSVLYVCVF